MVEQRTVSTKRVIPCGLIHLNSIIPVGHQSLIISMELQDMGVEELE